MYNVQMYNIFTFVTINYLADLYLFTKMVSLNKSFFYGICFASITWTISLYLYSQISNSDNVENFFSSLMVKQSKHLSNERVNNINYGKSLKKLEKNILNSKRSSYHNSNSLINSLQSIHQKIKSNNSIDEIGMVMSLEDQNLKDQGYKLYAFNTLISERLDYNREVPDTRNTLCQNVTYPDILPSATVVICFYNEHFQTLLRTVHSVISRTPENILKEIILIDDFSDIKNLHVNLSKFIKGQFKGKVKLFKTERREGLIRARLYGSRKASGEVIVFLDSHVEVNIDWIQPLLTRIQEDKFVVATPIIDIINADTFKYSPSPLVRGGFNWGLHFKWENLPIGTLSSPEDFIKPIKSPTMAGGLFAINKKVFVDLGEYDAGMNIWGGENIEFSLRIWMCGGKIEILPCSRVGHVFRQRRPYGDPDGQDTMLYNSLRAANVWLDDYKQYFLDQRTDARNMKFGDVSSRIQLRRELKCKDFEWYLKNVYPELTLPTDNEERLKNKWAALKQDVYQPWHSRKRNYVNQYQIRLTNSTLCLQSKKDVKSKGSLLIIKSCLRIKHQIWYETDKSELVLAQLLCLQANSPNPILYKCHEMGGDQEWKHKGENKTPIYNMAAGRCLSVDTKKSGAVVLLKMCSDQSTSTWDLVN